MINKIKTIYICEKCGGKSLKWSGKCLNCDAWGSMKEQIAETSAEIKQKGISENLKKAVSSKIVSFSDVRGADVKRIPTGIGEVDRVLGGGLVPGEIVLLSGEPGVGKSTLVAQLAAALLVGSEAPYKSGASLPPNVLYVSGEESASQLKLRFDRMNLDVKNLKYLGDTEAGMVAAAIDELSPALAIIDSIQTIHCDEVPSEAGSMNQVKISLAKITDAAKSKNIPAIIIGHITKDGHIAGPKTLEHMVDAVLHLEGDKNGVCRILRSPKNRFGGTDEIGIFEMKEKGLAEVKNPSELFLGTRELKPGTATTCIIEGSRPILVEVQALTSRSNFGYPQRRASGFDLNRLQVIVAVLAKRAGIYLNNVDIHLNVAGGLKIKEPAADLAVALAIISAYKNKPINPNLLICGELGLAGEIRIVPHLEKRLKEAEKMGFNQMIAPKSSIESPLLYHIQNLNEAIEFI
jgi:DNA repair protein RadA/Sms